MVIREERLLAWGVSGYSGTGAYSRKHDMFCRVDKTVRGTYGHSSPSNCEQPVQSSSGL